MPFICNPNQTLIICILNIGGTTHLQVYQKLSLQPECHTNLSHLFLWPESIHCHCEFSSALNFHVAPGGRQSSGRSLNLQFRQQHPFPQQHWSASIHLSRYLYDPVEHDPPISAGRTITSVVCSVNTESLTESSVPEERHSDWKSLPKEIYEF